MASRDASTLTDSAVIRRRKAQIVDEEGFLHEGREQGREKRVGKAVMSLQPKNDSFFINTAVLRE